MSARKKSRFSIVKLEERIATNLTLPSGNVVFAGFDNPSPGFYGYHPAVIARSQTAFDATEATGNPTTANPDIIGNEGPWPAHIVQNGRGGPITCDEAGCPGST